MICESTELLTENLLISAFSMEIVTLFRVIYGPFLESINWKNCHLLVYISLIHITVVYSIFKSTAWHFNFSISLNLKLYFSMLSFLSFYLWITRFPILLLLRPFTFKVCICLLFLQFKHYQWCVGILVKVELFHL